MRWLVGVSLCVVALSVAGPAAADAPTTFPVADTFGIVNPCTGGFDLVTVVGRLFVHHHGSRTVARVERTLTASDGSVGHGTDTFVNNGQVLMSRLTDILTNPAGYRMRLQSLLVVDLSTGTTTVQRLEFTCLGP